MSKINLIKNVRLFQEYNIFTWGKEKKNTVLHSWKTVLIEKNYSNSAISVSITEWITFWFSFDNFDILLFR